MFVIYGADWCSFCQKAKEVLSGKDYQFKDVDTVEAIDEMCDLLGYEPETVPQVFYDGQHVGGYDDLVRFLAEQG